VCGCVYCVVMFEGVDVLCVMCCLHALSEYGCVRVPCFVCVMDINLDLCFWCHYKMMCCFGVSTPYPCSLFAVDFSAHQNKDVSKQSNN
jgi:hypothetical protein